MNVPLGDFGVATFFNDEVLTLSPGESFSFCSPSDHGEAPVVFRSASSPDPQLLSQLPATRAATGDTQFELGLAWDFPYLLRLRYQTSFAGAATALNVTVPFGIASQTEAYQGTQEWLNGDFPLNDELLRCARFCDHPTFDSAGVYDVNQLFNATYLETCYRPLFPRPGDGGFPRDP